MQLVQLKPAAALLAAVAAFGASASAQEVRFSLGHRFPRAEVNFQFGYQAPRFTQPHCAPPSVWIPGHYEMRCEQVWVPGCTRQEWVPPCYEWRVNFCGERFQVLVRPGFWRTVVDAGRYEMRNVQVWVPGRYETPRY